MTTQSQCDCGHAFEACYHPNCSNARHVQAHPDYLELGIFAGYGEFDGAQDSHQDTPSVPPGSNQTINTSEARHFAPDDLIPVEYWGKDHYSTLAYVETIMVDCAAGFEVGLDPRMRANRRNFRVLLEGRRSPRRPSSTSWKMARTMDPKHTSFLKLGATSEDHDDWSCLQDMAAAGLFTDKADCVEPGNMLHLSDLGKRFVTELREFKASGGSFGQFAPSPHLAAAASTNLVAN